MEAHGASKKEERRQQDRPIQIKPRAVSERVIGKHVRQTPCATIPPAILPDRSD